MRSAPLLRGTPRIHVDFITDCKRQAPVEANVPDWAWLPSLQWKQKPLNKACGLLVLSHLCPLPTLRADL